MLIRYLESLNKTVIIYEDAAESGNYPKNVIIQSWKCWSDIGKESYKRNVRQGRGAIQST